MAKIKSTIYKGTVYEDFYNRLYNPELKIKFIEENYPVNKNTKQSILYMFVKSATVERAFDKDLCVFKIDEILDLAKRLDYKTIGTMQSAFSYFASYVDWCIANELRGSYEGDINDVAIFMQTQDLSQFLSRIRVGNMYLTKEEAYDLVDSLVNFQDKAYILGIYEGIGGEEMYELRSLKLENIDFDNNTVELTNIDNAKRTIKITDKLKNILAFANSQEEYLSANGKSLTVRRPRLLTQSPYILRPLYRQATSGKMMGYGTFSQKMVRIRKYVDYPFISISSITDSGAINRITELTEEQNLTKPTDEIFNTLSLPNEYNLPENSIYKLKEKYKLATSLKSFK